MGILIIEYDHLKCAISIAELYAHTTWVIEWRSQAAAQFATEGIAHSVIFRNLYNLMTLVPKLYPLPFQRYLNRNLTLYRLRGVSRGVNLGD